LKKMRMPIIAIKGAGEMASAVAWRLFMANFRQILMLEVTQPLAVRRKVSFCEAIYKRRQTVEGITAELVERDAAIRDCWQRNRIAVVVDPDWKTLEYLRPDVCVDAILAKKNLGTHLNEASLVIGLGPGFTAGEDVHLVIETNRGHNLGRVITSGGSEPNTGIPGDIGGYTSQRVFRAPVDGVFTSQMTIGDSVRRNQILGYVQGQAVQAEIDGIVRGIIRSGVYVNRGIKLGDIDPRGRKSYCDTISDKARAISGSVLEAVLRVRNQENKERTRYEQSIQS
jgi:xanthine dehydrogenase accessory factor